MRHDSRNGLFLLGVQTGIGGVVVAEKVGGCGGGYLSAGVAGDGGGKRIWRIRRGVYKDIGASGIQVPSSEEEETRIRN